MSDSAIFSTDEQRLQFSALAAEYGGTDYLGSLSEKLAIAIKQEDFSHRPSLIPLAQFWSQIVVGARFGFLLPTNHASNSFIRLVESSPVIRNTLRSRHFTLLQDFHIKKLTQESDCLRDQEAQIVFWDAFLIYSSARNSAPLLSFSRLLDNKDALDEIERRADRIADAYITEALKERAPGEAEAAALLQSLGYKATIGMADFLHLCMEVSGSLLDKQVEHSDWFTLRGTISELFDFWLAPLEDRYTQETLSGILTTMVKAGVIDAAVRDTYFGAISTIAGAKAYA